MQAAADNSWLVAVDLAAGDEEVLDSCSSSDSTFCNNCESERPGGGGRLVSVSIGSGGLGCVGVVNFRKEHPGTRLARQLLCPCVALFD